MLTDQKIWIFFHMNMVECAIYIRSRETSQALIVLAEMEWP